MRCLDGDVVVHTVDGVQPLVRSGLAAGTERDEHAVGDIALSEADLVGFGAIHRDVELRGVDLLVHAGINDTGDHGEFAFQFLGQFVATNGIAGEDLDVNG